MPSPHLLDDPAILRNWRPPRRMRVSEWADEHRVLEPLFASEPGPWKTDRAPYAREVMDSAGLPWVRRITWMASTQVGKSEAMNNIAGFYIHQRPSPGMFVLPNRDAARLAAERRILPMVQASSALRGELTEKSHDVKHREMVFKRSVLYMRSAQSPTDLASVPVRLVLADEVDKWPQWAGREAEPLALVQERQRTFHDSLLIAASTPTTRDGLIFREYMMGDQRHYYVPCPHCGEHQVLQFEQIKWDKEIRDGNVMRNKRAAWYECIACQQRITDQHKRDMLREGFWCPEDITVSDWLAGMRETERHDHRSYHLWSAYSPWVTFWRVAAQFLDSRGDPARMMNFTNSWLARVWEERSAHTSEAAIAATVGEAARTELPEDTVVVTAAVDVQGDYMVWMVVAWGADERNHVVDIGQDSTWQELTDALQRGWGKKQMFPKLICIDSRYRRDEVMEWTRRNPNVRMIAGVQRDNPVPFSTTRIDRHPKTGKALAQGLTVWTINVNVFKDLVAHRLQLSLREDEGEVVLGRMSIAGDLEPHWIRQMSAEHKIVKRMRGKVRETWQLKPGRQRNEAWDLLVYNAAAGRMLRLELLRSEGSQPAQRPKPKRRVMGAKRP